MKWGDHMWSQGPASGQGGGRESRSQDRSHGKGSGVRDATKLALNATKGPHRLLQTWKGPDTPGAPRRSRSCPKLDFSPERPELDSGPPAQWGDKHVLFEEAKRVATAQ